MDKMVLENPDDLVDYALSVLNGWEDVKRVELSDLFNYHIIVKGENWDGKFDQRVSQIVLSVHKAVTAAYAQAENIPYRTAVAKYKKELRVIAKVENGSSIIGIDLNLNGIGGVFTSMTGTESVVAVSMIVTGIVLSIGVFPVVSYFKHKNELLHRRHLRDRDSEEVQARIDASNKQIDSILRNNVDLLEKAQEPVRVLASVLDKDDKAQIRGVATPVDKHEVKKLAPYLSDIQLPETYYLDDAYKIRQWRHFEDLTAVIEKDGITLGNVEITLNQAERERLVQYVNTLEDIKLQITARVQGKDIQASIIGIGEPREGTVPLSAIKR